jgi:phage/plasmid-associated DNA primase
MYLVIQHLINGNVFYEAHSDVHHIRDGTIEFKDQNDKVVSFCGDFTVIETTDAEHTANAWQGNIISHNAMEVDIMDGEQ